MAEVVLQEVTKKFGDLVAVDRLDLRVEDGEFVVLVGPSGCGKTTILRMIAGLEELSLGEIYIGRQSVSDVSPKNRNIAMVFQNYALYPHMSVYDNIAFGLRLRKVPKREIDKHVREVAQLLGIASKLKNKPKELSGGECQRVAVGRAIARHPEVFLFDEPLSNLDAKLRMTMRAELQELHYRLKTTTIYVTHDQAEAMTLGGRVAVIKDGVMQQYDDPRTVFDHPVNMFVAGFLGSPAMNFLSAKLTREEGRLYMVNTGFKLKVPQDKARKLQGYIGRNVILGIRPENLKIQEMVSGHVPEAILEPQVRALAPMGNELIIYAKIGGAELVARLPPRTEVAVGQRIALVVEMEFMHIFDKDTEETVG